MCFKDGHLVERPFLQVTWEVPYPGEWRCRQGWRSAPQCSGQRSGCRPLRCRTTVPRSHHTHRPWWWGCWCYSWEGFHHHWSQWAGGTNPASADWTLRAGRTPLRCYLLEEGRQGVLAEQDHGITDFTSLRSAWLIWMCSSHPKATTRILPTCSLI